MAMQRKQAVPVVILGLEVATEQRKERRPVASPHAAKEALGEVGPKLRTAGADATQSDAMAVAPRQGGPRVESSAVRSTTAGTANVEAVASA
jgi:hypothetical protein